jgi:AbrB family looped-hinge helix DNA binding protein
MRMDSTTVTSKGQVTIPKDLRQRLGIRQGSRVRFSLVNGRVEMTLVSQTAEVRESGFGLLKSRRKTVPADFDPAVLAAASGARRRA